MLFALLAIRLLGAQQPAITFESPGITVKTFCAELSRQTGRTYEARDEIQADLLAIRVTNVQLDELLKKLTFVERARIENDGAKFILRPDEAVRSKLREARFATHVKAIQASQADLRQLLQAGPLTDEDAKAIAQKLSSLEKERNSDDQSISVQAFVKQQIQMERVPIGQTLVRIFTSIPPEELARLGSSGVGVWSTAPTPVERPMPIDGQTLAGELERDSQVWYDAAAKYLKGGSSPAMADYRGSTKAGSNRIALLQLVVHSARSHLFTAALQGYNAAGEVLISYVDAPHWQRDLKGLSRPRAAIASRPDWVAVPPETAKLIQLWSGYPHDTLIATWRSDPAFLEAYYHPEAHDPLAETFGKSILALAKARNRQVIACEADDFAHNLPESAIKNNKLDIGALEARLLHPEDPDYATIEYSSDDRWILARPQDLDVSAEAAFDRHNLGTLLRTARDKRNLDLTDVARYAAEHDDQFGPFSMRAARPLKGLVPGLTGFELLSDGSWPLKSFLGRLDETQIAVGQSPGGLSLANCTEAQLHALRVDLSFGALSYRGRTSGFWQNNETDGLPRGLPGGGVLHLSVAHSPSLLVRIGEPGAGVEARHRSPEETARRLHHQPGDELENSYNLISLQPEVNTNYVFHFDFPGDISRTERLNSYSASAPAVTRVEDLPKDLRIKVQAAINKLGS